MEFDSPLMQPKVVLDLCDITEYTKQESIDYKPKAKRKTKKSVTSNSNPWNVSDLEQFLVYSCPECDTNFRHDTRDTFIAHANAKHPKSRPFMFMFNLKEEEFLSNGFEEIISKTEEDGNVDNEEDGNEDNEEGGNEDNEEGKDFDDLEDSEPLEFIESNENSVVNNFKEDKSDLESTEPISIKDEKETKDIFQQKAGQTPFCTICNKSYKSLDSLKVHIRKFHQETKKRETCGSSLKKVLKKITDSDDLICKICNEQFPTQSGFYAHNKSVHADVPKETKKGRPAKYTCYVGTQIQCEVCQQKLACSSSLNRHMKRFHPNDKNKSQNESKEETKEKKVKVELVHGKHDCLLCETSFTDESLLSHHMRMNHKEDGVFKCPICLEKFDEKNFILFHMTEVHHIGQFKHKCDTCDKPFVRFHELKVHNLKAHTNLLKLVCQICGKEFNGKGSLEGHMKHIHNEYQITEKDTTKVCDKCDTSFSQPDIFDSHLKLCIKNPKDYKCKFCELLWASHSSLEMHIAVSHQKLVNVCDICGKVVRLGTLNEHKKIVHNKNHEHVCHICPKTFPLKKGLKTHLANVHGESDKQYKCEHCGKIFFDKYRLKFHVEAIHNHSKVFQCPECPKIFSMKIYMQTHLKAIHQGYKPNKCDLCDEAYFAKRDLIKHKANVHHV